MPPLEFVINVPPLGSIVIYRLSEKDTGAFLNNGAIECPAVIVGVYGARVNLRLLNDGVGPIERRSSVTYGEEPGQWRWPTNT